jgi:ABC-2 type transport system permease protein
MTTQSAGSHGPSALGSSLQRFVQLTLTLARTDFKLRYFGSALGYFWQLVRPLLFFGVIYVFFTQIVRVSKGIPHYGAYLLTSIVLWTFFAEATSTSVSCMVGRESLLRKIRFPRMVVPLSTSMTAAFNLGLNMIVAIAFALISGVSPALSWLWMIPIILGFLVLATGTGLLLSALYVRFRDIQPIWEVTTQILFYASPIMYTAIFYKRFEHVAMLNPIAMMLTQMGHTFIHPGSVPLTVAGHVVVVNGHPVVSEPMPSALHAAGGPLLLAISLAILFGMFAIGWLVFTREAPRISENL